MLITPDPDDSAKCQERMLVTPTDVNYAPIKHCGIIIIIIAFQNQGLSCLELLSSKHISLISF